LETGSPKHAQPGQSLKATVPVLRIAWTDGDLLVRIRQPHLLAIRFDPKSQSVATQTIHQHIMAGHSFTVTVFHKNEIFIQAYGAHQEGIGVKNRENDTLAALLRKILR